MRCGKLVFHNGEVCLTYKQDQEVSRNLSVPLLRPAVTYRTAGQSNSDNKTNSEAFQNNCDSKKQSKDENAIDSQYESGYLGNLHRSRHHSQTHRVL